LRAWLAKPTPSALIIFIIKDNPFGQSQIAVVAVDTANVVQENVNGDFAFTVNGFDQQLTFNKGVAFYSPKIEKIYLSVSAP